MMWDILLFTQGKLINTAHMCIIFFGPSLSLMVHDGSSRNRAVVTQGKLVVAVNPRLQ